MLNIIPSPKIIEELQEKFDIDTFSSCKLCMPCEDSRIDYLINRVWENITIEKTLCEARYTLSVGNIISGIPEMHKNNISDKRQGYYIRLDEKGAFVYSFSVEGLFYGIQTIKQIIENNENITACEIVDYPDIENRSMYIDLRQTFPKFELLLSYIEMMAEFKTNKLIIEYEDKFPFEKYSFLRHSEFCFTDEQIDMIMEIAYRNFIEVIPLQQSYGHLEYVLKHTQFKHLREISEASGEVCSCNDEAIMLVKELIDEVIRKHPKCNYVHLGCDEVWSLCSCDECKKRFSGSKEKLFIEYVNKLISYVCSKGKKPVIWNDMLAKCPEEDLEKLDKRVAVMIWLYRSTGTKKDVRTLASMLKKQGLEVIGGSAVRCNDGDDTQNYPKAADRIKNIDFWTDAALENNISFMVSTNWATSFAMGAPYGIFETSMYFMYYSGERYWNNSSDKDTFLNRFLRVFHGIDFPKYLSTKAKQRKSALYSWDILEPEDCTITDYYKLLPEIADEASKHKEFANYMKVIAKLEIGMRMLRTINAFSYRTDMFGDSEAEMTTLTTRVEWTIRDLFATKMPLYESLLNFMPPKMAEIYVNSRFFIPELLHEHFYKGLLKIKPE